MVIISLGPGVAIGADFVEMTGTTPIGASVGSVFAAAALAYAVAYLDVLGADPESYGELRSTLVAVSITLLIVFAATILSALNNIIT